MNKFFQWLKTTLGGMVTEHDNKTHDLIKHGGWIALVAVLGLTGYHEYQKIHVQVRDLAISLSIVLAGTGAGVGVKSGSEHNEVSDEQEAGGAQ